MDSHSGQTKSRKKAPPSLNEDIKLAPTNPQLCLQQLSKCNQTLLQSRSPQITTILSIMHKFSYPTPPQKPSSPLAPKIVIAVGKPSTGKTSTIKYCIQKWIQQIKENSEKEGNKQLQGVQVVGFNGYSLKKCADIVEEIQNALDEKVSDKVTLQVEKFHKNKKQSKDNEQMINLIIIYIEQFQKVIQDNTQKSLNDFFENLPKSPPNRYLFLTATNSINIEQTLKKKCPSLNPKTIIFQPYSLTTLQQIFTSKIKKMQTFLHHPIKFPGNLCKYLLTKLSQHKKDDTRILLQICRELWGYLLGRGKGGKGEKGEGEEGEGEEGEEGIVVDLVEIKKLGYVRELLGSPKIAILERLPLKMQMVLLVIYLGYKNKMYLDMPYSQVFDQFVKMQKSMGIQGYEDVMHMVKQLESYDLLQIRGLNVRSKKGEKVKSGVKIVLKIGLSDIQAVLGENPTLRKYIE